MEIRRISHIVTRPDISMPSITTTHANPWPAKLFSATPIYMKWYGLKPAVNDNYRKGRPPKLIQLYFKLRGLLKLRNRG